MKSNTTLKELKVLVPAWVPTKVLMYIAHFEYRYSMRAIAAEFSVHPSTVSRQLNKLNRWLSDPLATSGLQKITENISKQVTQPTQDVELFRKKSENLLAFDKKKYGEFDRLRTDILTRMFQENLVLLAVGQNFDKICFASEKDQKMSIQWKTVCRDVVEALAVCGFISRLDTQLNLAYRITLAGVQEQRLQCGNNSTRRSFLDQQVARSMAFSRKTSCLQENALVTHNSRSNRRVSTPETPVQTLSRLRDKSGKVFLDQRLVKTAQRFKEDFEIAKLQSSRTRQIQPAQEYQPKCFNDSCYPNENFRGAIDFLGPVLSEVALRCCCFQHGMGRIEEELGWSARSGKIVVRIALLQLEAYYLSSRISRCADSSPVPTGINRPFEAINPG